MTFIILYYSTTDIVLLTIFPVISCVKGGAKVNAQIVWKFPL